MDINTLAVGQRLRLIQDVDVFLLGSFPKGAAGTIETIELDLGYIHLRMDDVFPALAPFDNLLEVYVGELRMLQQALEQHGDPDGQIQPQIDGLTAALEVARETDFMTSDEVKVVSLADLDQMIHNLDQKIERSDAITAAIEFPQITPPDWPTDPEQVPPAVAVLAKFTRAYCRDLRRSAKNLPKFPDITAEEAVTAMANSIEDQLVHLLNTVDELEANRRSH